jgi:hypothetical protein
MEKGSSTVIDALNSALETPGSTSATTESKETAAPKGPETTETAPDKGKGTQGKPEKETPQTVPYSRLAEVVAEKNTLKELYDEANTKHSTVTSKLVELEREVDVLNRVRALAQDERYKDHVMAIDEALRGVEKEVEKLGDNPTDGAVDKVLKNISTQNAKLEEKLAEERASRLFNEASDYFDKLADALPKEYGDSDKKAIAKDCAERIDWNKIEGDESQVKAQVRAAFKTTLDDYGTPRAGLEAQLAELQAKLNSSAPVTELNVNTPTKVIEGLLAKDYGVKDDKGKFVTTDADFAKDLVAVIKNTRT